MTATETICQAIAVRQRLSLRYGGSVRIVDPYILGHDAEGNLILSAVQRSGGSGQGFRTFAVDAIEALAIDGGRFFGNDRRYNPRDRLFANILCQV